MKCPQCNNIFNKEESICNLCDKCCDKLFVLKSDVTKLLEKVIDSCFTLNFLKEELDKM